MSFLYYPSDLRHVICNFSGSMPRTPLLLVVGIELLDVRDAWPPTKSYL